MLGFVIDFVFGAIFGGIFGFLVWGRYLTHTSGKVGIAITAGSAIFFGLIVGIYKQGFWLGISESARRWWWYRK